MVAIGSDHGGFKLKEYIKSTFEGIVKFKDFGTFSENSCDYPIIAKSVAEAVVSEEFGKGIIICTTGIGVSIAANKVKGIRAALCYDEISTEMARKHNNANILCIGSAKISTKTVKNMINIFLNTSFEGGRHQRRIDMIKEIEKQ